CSSDLVLAVDLAKSQSHRHPHEECLRQFKALAVAMQEVAIVERLQAEILEIEIALRLESRAYPLQVEALQLRIDQASADARCDELRKIARVSCCHLRLRRLFGTTGNEAQCLAAQFVHQETSGNERIVRLLLDQRARCHDRRQ